MGHEADPHLAFDMVMAYLWGYHTNAITFLMAGVTLWNLLYDRDAWLASGQSQAPPFLFDWIETAFGEMLEAYMENARRIRQEAGRATGPGPGTE